MYHIPVLLKSSVDALNIRKGGIYADTTLGGGGHSREILEKLGGSGHLYSFDQDEDAIKYVMESGLTESPNFTLIDKNFTFLSNYLTLYGVTEIDGLLADLGVSSHQFDVAERGFSIRENAPLDMRMDRRQPLNASDIVNSYEQEKLSNIFYLYGELSNARKIASIIVKERQTKRIDDTQTLIEILQNLAPKGKENKFFAMVFQALRIEVNNELQGLEKLLQEATKALVKGGRIVVLSYHSLEDRMVKRWMRTGNIEGKLEKDFYGNIIAPLKPVVTKAIVPSEEEVEKNPRARSAKMRVAEKL
ncbi:MAG: 16S rRNA (cytosine(1402)-N(4))-methyltransferase RsmH [Bacteroidales bacterium]|jgi:16S rRNA (cytosine1402-N4)-methyltransferase|nr:16S rRNA (cytosine(1402)-N(4))-methyltransferase RsmH [Bacteroidales bacterium]